MDLNHNPVEDHGEAISANADVSWHGRKYMTDVGNQNITATCVPFSILDTLSAKMAILAERNGEPVPEVAQVFSKQELYDCVERPWDDIAMKYLVTYRYIQNNGVHLEANYPFNAQYRCYCQADQIHGPKITIDGCNWVKEEEQVLERLKEHPLVARINHPEFCNHVLTGDVFNPGHEYVPHSLRRPHSVMVIGYGEEGGVPYYIVKNSQGLFYGLNGYVKVARYLLSHFSSPGHVHWM